METATTSGTAGPSACGQVITITVTARSTAKARSRFMKSSQMRKVPAPLTSAMRVSHIAAVSARFCVLDLLSWACLSKSITCDRNESLPVLL